MKKISIILLILPLLIYSCKQKEEDLTEKSAMAYFLENTPERGATFYNNNRDKYSFLDKLYRDSIYPAVMDCNYHELKYIYYALKKTPIAEDIYALLKESKLEIMRTLSVEIQQNMEIEQDAFISEIIPIMKIGIDSIIHSDIETIIEEYAGGLLNYKKLYFFTGRDQVEFQKIWKSTIRMNKYREYVESTAKQYLETICELKKQYLHDITDRDVTQKITYDLPSLSFKLSDEIINHVQEFTLKEKREMTNEALKDWIAPIAIGLLTGGTGAAIYEIGSTGYDIKVTIDDIKNQKMESNEMLMYICENDIYNQIKEEYLNEYTANILKEIENINQRTYYLIDYAL